MIAVDTFFLLCVMIFAFFGAKRGFLKELGVTLILIATLFALDRLIPITVGFINAGGLQFLDLKIISEDHKTQTLTAIFFLAIILGSAAIAYWDEPLAYEGREPRFPIGVLLGLIFGAVNGYLIIGSAWWILNYFYYPIGDIVWFPLPETAQLIIYNGLLPIDLLGGGATTLSSWGLLPFILILLIILKVIL